MSKPLDFLEEPIIEDGVIPVEHFTTLEKYFNSIEFVDNRLTEKSIIAIINIHLDSDIPAMESITDYKTSEEVALEFIGSSFSNIFNWIIKIINWIYKYIVGLYKKIKAILGLSKEMGKENKKKYKDLKKEDLATFADLIMLDYHIDWYYRDEKLLFNAKENMDKDINSGIVFLANFIAITVEMYEVLEIPRGDHEGSVKIPYMMKEFALDDNTLIDIIKPVGEFYSNSISGSIELMSFYIESFIAQNEGVGSSGYGEQKIFDPDTKTMDGIVKKYNIQHGKPEDDLANKLLLLTTSNVKDIDVKRKSYKNHVKNMYLGQGNADSIENGTVLKYIEERRVDSVYAVTNSPMEGILSAIDDKKIIREKLVDGYMTDEFLSMRDVLGSASSQVAKVVETSFGGPMKDLKKFNKEIEAASKKLNDALKIRDKQASSTSDTDEMLIKRNRVFLTAMLAITKSNQSIVQTYGSKHFKLASLNNDRFRNLKNLVLLAREKMSNEQ